MSVFAPQGCRLAAKSGLMTTAAVLTIFLMGTATPSLAQQAAPVDTDTPSAEREDPANVGDVVVTASRVTRRGFEAPTPTTVSDIEDIQKTGLTNVADFLNTQPSFVSSTTPASTVRASQNAGGNFLNLRGLGNSRTLVLVDGRRFVPTSSSGLIDINVIPSFLVERVEVVTGGASAAWGSDAVSGVVNMILKKNLDGLELKAQIGETQYGDGENYTVSAAYGRSFLDGRGRFIIGAEYADDKGVPGGSDRDWVKRQPGLVVNPAYAVGNGQYRYLLADGVHISTAALGGLITAGPLQGTLFLPNGQTGRFSYGSSMNTTAMIGGDGTNIGSDMSPLVTPVTRGSVFTRATYDFTPNLSGFVELSYANSETEFDLSAHRDLAAITINRDNAYLPASVRAAMVANNITTFRMGRISPDTGMNIVDDENGTERYLAGLNGTVFGDWTWNAHYEYGRTRYSARVFENRINANYTLAIDAVVHPVTGQIVCRSTLTNPTNGCVPMNLFGLGSPSAEARAYVTGTQTLLAHITENSGAFNIEGEPFSTPAGVVSVAAGLEYRKEEIVQQVDGVSIANILAIGNPYPLSGQYDATEGYMEVVVPVLADLPFAKSLDFNGAVRVTDYSTSGTATSWKAGLTYDFNDDWRLRASQSRDIRAPNLGELYSSYVLTFSEVRDPVTGVNIRVGAPSQGNTLLAPETGNTTTFGLIYQPSALPSLRLSMDYFDIRVEDVISTLSAQEILDRCQAGNTSLCGFIERNSSGVLTTVTRAYVNLSEFSTRGLDFEGSYGFDFRGGRISLRGLATYVDEFITDDGVSASDAAGEYDQPHWRWVLSATYDRGPLSLNIQGKYTGGGKRDNDYGEFDINDNTVGSNYITNFSFTYDVPDTAFRQMQLFTVIRNVFNTDPPVTPNTGALNAITNSIFDVRGRTFTAGVRMKF